MSQRIYLAPCKLRFSFRQNPIDFVVEELPLLSPSKKGRYAVLKVRKKNLTTLDLVDEIGSLARSIGYAGLKDKHATTIQYISIDSRDLDQVLRYKAKKWEILEHFKSAKPLKIGDHAGNRFWINLYGIKDLQKLRNCLDELSQIGVPNYFGYQRFGQDGLKQAKAFVHGEFFPKSRRMQLLLWRIYQSYLFNEWLAKRVKMSKGHFKELCGDVYRIEGRYVIAKEPFYAKEMVVTGLLPGRRVMRARCEAAKIEQVYDEDLHLRGDRRDALFYPKDIEVEKINCGARVAFTLPKGSYATIVIENLLGKNLDHKGI